MTNTGTDEQRTQGRLLTDAAGVHSEGIFGQPENGLEVRPAALRPDIVSNPPRKARRRAHKDRLNVFKARE